MIAPETLPRPMLQSKRTELIALCEQFGVARLELFGSAARRADHAESDLDFLVEFVDWEHGSARRYFGLLFGLEELFKRKIDLVMPSAVRNRFMIRSIEQERTLLYAA